MPNRLLPLSIAAAAMLTACTHTTREIHHVREAADAPAASENQDLVVRRYDVAEGAAEPVRSMLRYLFARKEGAVARAAVSPDGKIVVAAPRSVHESLAEVIAATEAVDLASPSSVAVTYWLVEARPATTASLDPDLAEIEAPLRALGKEPAVFRQVERITLSSAEDVTASHEARLAEVRQTVHDASYGVVADLRMEHHGRQGTELSTRVELPHDAPVVVGTTELEPDDDGTRATLLYVVRARRLHAGS